MAENMSEVQQHSVYTLIFGHGSESLLQTVGTKARVTLDAHYDLDDVKGKSSTTRTLLVAFHHGSEVRAVRCALAASCGGIRVVGLRLTESEQALVPIEWPSNSLLLSAHEPWSAFLLRIALLGRFQPPAVAEVAKAAFQGLTPESLELASAIVAGDPRAASLKLWTTSTGVSRWALRRHLRDTCNITPAELMGSLRGCVALALLRHQLPDIRRVTALLGESDPRRVQRCISAALGSEGLVPFRADVAAELLERAIQRLKRRLVDCRARINFSSEH